MKAISDPNRVKADSSKANLTPCELDLPPTCEIAQRAHHAGLFGPLPFLEFLARADFADETWRFEAFRTQMLAIWSKMTLYPLKRLI